MHPSSSSGTMFLRYDAVLLFLFVATTRRVLRRRDECCDDETSVAVVCRVFFVVRRLGPPAVEVHHVYQFNVFTFHLLVLGLHLLFAVF